MGFRDDIYKLKDNMKKGTTMRLQTSPELVEFLDDDIPASILLNQCMYWHDITKSGWFFKSYLQWEKETRLKKSVVHRCMKKLQDMDILEVKRKKVNGTPINHYKVLDNNLRKKFAKFLAKKYASTGIETGIEN